MYGSHADGAGVRHRQLRLLPARRHQPRRQRVELAGDRARRVAARAGTPGAGRHDRRRRPVADRVRGQGGRPPGGAARPGLGAAARDGQGDPRRGARAPARTAPNSPPAWRICAPWSPRPTSTTSRGAATSTATRSAVWHGFRHGRGRAMVVTRTGVSMHVAGTVAEWLGHVLNVITGRMDRPGGRRFEPGYVDAIRMSGMVKASPHRSRLSGREMVAGAHALSELPAEITTPGRGQIRAMVINCGNPVVSGPDGAKLDDGSGPIGSAGGHRLRAAGKPPPRALAVARRALAGTRRPAGVHQQHARRAVSCSTASRPSSRRRVRARNGGSSSTSRSPCASRCSAPRGSTASSRPPAGLPRLTRRPGLEFDPHWIDRLVVATVAKVQRPQAQVARRRRPSARHGCWDRASSGTSGTRCAPTTRRCMPRRPSSSRGRGSCWPTPHPEAPAGYPFQLANRRHRHSMNSWLNELPGLHPAGKGNEVLIHPDDAAALGIGDGDRVRVFSPVGAIELAAALSRTAPPRRRRGRPRLGFKDFRSPRRCRAAVLRRQPQPAGRRRSDRPAVPDLDVELVLRRRRATGLIPGPPPSEPAGPRRAGRRRYDIASRSLPSHSSACSPTSRTDHASASDRDRATPASTRVSSTWRSGCRSRVITGTAMCVNRIRSV